MSSSALSSAEFFLNQRVNRRNYLPIPTMPDRRFRLLLLKKACRCKHGFNAHHLKKAPKVGRIRGPGGPTASQLATNMAKSCEVGLRTLTQVSDCFITTSASRRPE